MKYIVDYININITPIIGTKTELLEFEKMNKAKIIQLISVLIKYFIFNLPHQHPSSIFV